MLLAVGSTNVSTVKPTDANAGPRSGDASQCLQVVDLVGHQDGDHVGLLGMGAWCGPRQHGSVAPGLTWGRTDNLAPSSPLRSVGLRRASRAGSGVDGDDDPPHGLSGHQVAQGCGGLLEREGPVDDDAELAGLQEPGQGGHQLALVR